MTTTESADVGAHPSIFEGRVDADAAVAFALATNDRNDRYLRGEAVPPSFTAGLVLSACWDAQERDDARYPIRDDLGAVHGEHDIWFWGRVAPGMDLRWQATAHSARQTRRGVLVTQRCLVSDAGGTPLVEHLWSNFHAGATLETDAGPPLVDHTFPERARALRIGSRSVPVDRDQAFRYAGVSGDHAGHAIDDEIARQEGYPGKILQGMCTFGLCSGAVVDIAAGGDPGRLRRLAARFSAPARPNRDLVVDIFDAGRSSEGGRALAYEAVQDGVVVIKHGRAELMPG